MQSHLTDLQFQNYHERKLAPNEFLEVDDHLFRCESCRSRLSQYTTKEEILFGSLRESVRSTTFAGPDHLSYEQLEALVDGKLDSVDLEIAQSHLDICPQCKAEELDLLAFKSNMDRKATSGKVIPFWRSPAFSVPLRIAGAAAVLIFVSWLSTLPLRNQVKELQTQLEIEKSNTAKLLQENKDLQQKYAAFIESQKEEGESPSMVALRDGNSIVQLDQRGQLTGLPDLPASYQQTIIAALTNQELETPESLRNLIGKQETLLGNSDASNRFELLNPVGTVVAKERPTFHWAPLIGAEGYRVHVFDQNYNEIASSSQSIETTWTIPKPLLRGRTYNWQVAALKSGKEYLSPVPPAPEAKFQVLSDDNFKQLGQIKQISGNSHLVMGTLYAQYGLLDDAEREFNALSKENKQSEVVKRLLNNIQSLRRITSGPAKEK